MTDQDTLELLKEQMGNRLQAAGPAGLPGAIPAPSALGVGPGTQTQAKVDTGTNSGISGAKPPAMPKLSVPSAIPPPLNPDNSGLVGPLVNPVGVIAQSPSPLDARLPTPLETAQNRADQYNLGTNKPESLMQRAGNIQNPVLRTLGKIGAGIGTVGEGIGSIVAPEVFGHIPGTPLNYNLNKLQANKDLATMQGQAKETAGTELTQADIPAKQASTTHQNLENNIVMNGVTPEKGADGSIIGFSRNGQVVGPDSYTPEMKGLISASQDAVKAVPEKNPTILGMLQKAHPDWTPEQIQTQMEKPLTKETADSGNAVWAKYSPGAPPIFRTGMTKDEYTLAEGTLNAAIGKNQGQQHINITVQGQKDKEATAAAKVNKGTVAQQNRSGAAADNLANVPTILSQIDANSGSIGPIHGRISEALIQHGLSTNTDLSNLSSQLDLLKTGIGLVHFGVRGGPADFRAKQDAYFSLAQPPETLKAHIAGAEQYLRSYMNEGDKAKLGDNEEWIPSKSQSNASTVPYASQKAGGPTVGAAFHGSTVKSVDDKGIVTTADGKKWGK